MRGLHMIFVTVGTTFFNALLEEVDRLAADGFFGEEIVCQIGSSEYRPKHCRYFKFTDQFDRYLESCSLLISHGGMTVLEAIWRNKRILAVANPLLAGGTQASYLKHLSSRFGLVWTDDPAEIKALARVASETKFTIREQHISTYILSLL